MLQLTEEQQRDFELASRISQDARRNARSPYAGKWLAVLRGQVVVVADSVDDAFARLRAIEPDRSHGVLIEANADYSSVQEIWR